MAKWKTKEGMMKYITVSQGSASSVAHHLHEQLGLKVSNLGWTDGSTTITTLMVRTKKSLDAVQECAWKATAWVSASLTNPIEKPLRLGTWYD
jgi:hypothetical protein